MSMHDPGLTLEQIIEFTTDAIEIVHSGSYDTTMSNKMIRRAFERVMECVGEAVKRLPQELRAANPEIPWRLIAGMRDRLSHCYDGIQHPVLWAAARDDLPLLLSAAKRMLAEIDGKTTP